MLAAVVGYLGYSGTVLDQLGLRGVKQTKDSIVSRQRTLDSLIARTDSAKRAARLRQRGRPAAPAGGVSGAVWS